MELVIKRLMLHAVLGDDVNLGDDQDNRQGAESRGGGIGAQGCRGESFFFNIALGSIFQVMSAILTHLLAPQIENFQLLNNF